MLFVHALRIVIISCKTRHASRRGWESWWDGRGGINVVVLAADAYSSKVSFESSKSIQFLPVKFKTRQSGIFAGVHRLGKP